MTLLVFSSLGRGTSLRTLAKLVPAVWGVTELACRRELALIAAAARKGTIAVVGLTVELEEDGASVRIALRVSEVGGRWGFRAPRRAIETADRDDWSILGVRPDFHPDRRGILEWRVVGVVNGLYTGGGVELGGCQEAR
jgi:hypothetical protein